MFESILTFYSFLCVRVPPVYPISISTSLISSVSSLFLYKLSHSESIDKLSFGINIAFFLSNFNIKSNYDSLRYPLCFIIKYGRINLNFFIIFKNFGLVNLIGVFMR